MDADRQWFCERLQAETYDIAQECVNALLLCESVYKACDGGPHTAAGILAQWKQQFGETCTLTRLQCTLPHVQHRYVLGNARDALYVALQGTKNGMDLVTDLNFWFGPVWEDTDVQLLSAHRGFLERSRQIPAEALLAWAQQHGKRLIFCGHSLGGAVAVLCTLRLLRGLGNSGARSSVCCITFGMPAIGNAALANHVGLLGWHRCFTSFVLPEDPVPRLMAASASPALAAAEAEAAVGQGRPGRCKPDAVALEPQPANDPADGSKPAAAEHATAGVPGYLHRWNSLRKAALASAASLQQALPLQSRFVHFGKYCSLGSVTQKEQQPEMHASADAKPATAWPGLLLAGHRMPSYRARVLALAGRLTGVQSTAGADVTLSSALAPQLASVTASALHPPLPPPQQSRSAAAAADPSRLHAVRSSSRAWRWLPVGAGSNDAGGIPGSVRLHVSLAASGDAAALHSITSARLRQPGRASMPMSWVMRIGPPPVQADDDQPANGAGGGPGSVRPWLASLLSSAGWQQPPPQQPSEQRSVLEVVLPVAQARQLLEQPQMSLKLRSDFAEAAVAVQLRRQLLWVLGGSAAATAQLLARPISGAAQSETSMLTPGPDAGMSSAWLRSRAQLPMLCAAAAVQDPAGEVPIGLQYLQFSSATARLDQHCASLLQLLQRLPSAGTGRRGSHEGLWQRLLDAARMVWMPHSAGRMLRAEAPPQLLLCIVPPQDAHLRSVSGACAAAAAAGIEVLIAVSPAQADSLTMLLGHDCTSGWPPVVLQLHDWEGDGPHHSHAGDVLEQLYKMMLRIGARTSVPAVSSKL